MGASARAAALAAALTGVQVGATMVATRFVIGQTAPASLALLRYAIGVVCLAPAVLLAAPRPRFAPRDVLRRASRTVTTGGRRAATAGV